MVLFFESIYKKKRKPKNPYTLNRFRFLNNDQLLDEYSSMLNML